jgi:hypothetical protein
LRSGHSFQGTRAWVGITDTLLPQLRQFGPPAERKLAITRAREEPLDPFEWVAMAVALLFVALLTRHSLESLQLGTRIGYVLLNFAVATPLLAIAIGPFHIRRLRRGLQRQLDARHGLSPHACP